MKQPQTRPEIPGPDLKEVTFSPLPTHTLFVVGHMRALRNIKPHIEKGKIYSISCITDRGMVMVQGDLERTYPMAAFGAPRARMGLEQKSEDDNAPGK